MLINRENCPLRHANGNCLPVGGFCTSVNDQICGGLRQAYDHGRAKMVGPHWISVKDVLPGNEQYVILWTKTGVMKYAKYLDDEPHRPWITYDEGGSIRAWDNVVTHWMPLPEPPKEDEA